MPSLDLSITYANFLAANKRWNDEMIKRDKIRFSKEYLAKVSQAELLMDEANEMLEAVPDTTSKDLEAMKKRLQKQIADEGLSHFENVKLKYRKQKSVDKNELLKVIDGDMDLYLSLSNVTQVSLQNHAKGSVNEKELLDCVKEEQIPSDIELVEPSES